MWGSPCRLHVSLLGSIEPSVQDNIQSSVKDGTLNGSFPQHRSQAWYVISFNCLQHPFHNLVSAQPWLRQRMVACPTSHDSGNKNKNKKPKKKRPKDQMLARASTKNEGRSPSELNSNTNMTNSFSNNMSHHLHQPRSSLPELLST